MGSESSTSPGPFRLLPRSLLYRLLQDLDLDTEPVIAHRVSNPRAAPGRELPPFRPLCLKSRDKHVGQTLEVTWAGWLARDLLLPHFRGNLDSWDPALIDDPPASRRVITFDYVGNG